MPKPTLIMMNMTYHHLWKQGMVNRNFHVLRQLQLSGLFDRIVSIDVLPLSTLKVARVAAFSRPWLKNTQTIHRAPTYRIDTDPVHASTVYVSSYGLKSVQAALSTLGVSISSSVVWGYDPLSIEQMAAYSPAYVVFDAVDNWMEHPAYAHMRERLARAYAYIADRADLIFTVSEGLLDVFHRPASAYFVPNGVDWEHFGSTEYAMKDFTLSHESPIVGYHGVIQSRMNFSILQYVIEKHPEYQFRFVGPVWKDVKKEVAQLQKQPHVQMKGAISYLRLPEMLHQFDCAIIPHKIDAFTHSMNPLKLYEYLASGLPIVSTPIAGADVFQDLVRFAVSPEEFSQEIQKAIATDSLELRKRRRAMAEQHTWQKRFAIMEKLLRDHGVLPPMIYS